MIIVEGPDGAGKTTLVKEIANTFSLKLGQKSVVDRDQLFTVTRKDTYTALSMAVLGHDPPLVWDRMYFSELVYYPYTTGKCQFTGDEQAMINDIIAALHIPVIYCRPPTVKICANVFKEEHQMEGVRENIVEIIHAYDNVLDDARETHGVEMFYYDYFHPLPLFEKIDEYLAFRKEREW